MKKGAIIAWTIVAIIVLAGLGYWILRKNGVLADVAIGSGSDISCNQKVGTGVIYNSGSGNDVLLAPIGPLASIGIFDQYQNGIFILSGNNIYYTDGNSFATKPADKPGFVTLESGNVYYQADKLSATDVTSSVSTGNFAHGAFAYNYTLYVPDKNSQTLIGATPHGFIWHNNAKTMLCLKSGHAAYEIDLANKTQQVLADQLSYSWKLYTSTDPNFVFSVKYPSTETPRVINSANATVAFEITSNGDTATQGNGQSVTYYKTNQTLDAIVAGAKADLPSSSYSVSAFNETIGGAPAIELQIMKLSDSSVSFDIFTKHNDVLYQIIGARSDQNFPTFVQSLQFTK